MNQDKNKIKNEDQFNRLHQQAPNNLDHYKSTPGLGILLGIIVHGKRHEIQHRWVSIDGQSALQIQFFRVNMHDKTSHPIQGKCTTYRVNELKTLLKIINQAIDLDSMEKEISAIEDYLIHNPTRSLFK